MLELQRNGGEGMKKCRHYWQDGYTMEPIIYCKICDVELYDLIGASSGDYTTRKGKLIPRIFANEKIHLF